MKVNTKQRKTLRNYVGKHPGTKARALSDRFAERFGIEHLSFVKRLDADPMLYADQALDGRGQGWFLDGSESVNAFGPNKQKAREVIMEAIKGLEINHFATLCGDKILDDVGHIPLERWILKENPEARGIGAEEKPKIFKKIKKNMDRDTAYQYTLYEGDFGDALRGLPERVELDFVFADFCGGVTLQNMDTVEEAFRRARKGSVIAVTSTLGLRVSGGYYAAYGHSTNNQLCVTHEIINRAESWGCEVIIDIFTYTDTQPMFVLIFTVKNITG